ncbi:MAG TPA: hypothetical protein ENJ95_17445 [Bacteroidetes bacterium]|nr:hypothetical protein [Bacteroidota bacterium]
MPHQFDFGMVEHLFPEYLTKLEKGRLLKALAQFKDETEKKKWSSKIYTNFYGKSRYGYFLQGDMVREIRYPDYVPQNKSFDRTFTDALILSNTCDLEKSNLRKMRKQVVMAPLLEMGQFVEEASNYKGAKEIILGIKAQTVSNIFYLPPSPNNGKEYVCHFDKAFWFPTAELNSYLPDIKQTRIHSLDYFGYYLFLVKLSYHFCRLPEEKQR